MSAYTAGEGGSGRINVKTASKNTARTSAGTATTAAERRACARAARGASDDHQLRHVRDHAGIRSAIEEKAESAVAFLAEILRVLVDVHAHERARRLERDAAAELQRVRQRLLLVRDRIV